MKVYIPQIDSTVTCEAGCCQTIVIENQKVWCDILNDLADQSQGAEGKIVLSNEDKVLPMAKHAEMVSQFIPFDMNQKGLITKIVNRMQQRAIGEDYFLKMSTLIAEWEQLLLEISTEMTGHISFSKVNIESLIKAAGVEVENVYDNLGEKLLDYFELVQIYDHNKLFFLINLRSYLSDGEMEEFFEDVQNRGYTVLFIDAMEHPISEREHRIIVDADQCILC